MKIDQLLKKEFIFKEKTTVQKWKRFEERQYQDLIQYLNYKMRELPNEVLSTSDEIKIRKLINEAGRLKKLLDDRNSTILKPIKEYASFLQEHNKQCFEDLSEIINCGIEKLQKFREDNHATE